MSEINGDEGSKRILDQLEPWKNNDNSVWLATTVSLSRNIEKFEFPAKLTPDRSKQVVSLLSREIMGDSLKKPVIYKAEELNSLEKEFLSEHFFSTLIFQQTHAGEAFIMDETGQFLAVINLNDHVRFILLDTKGEIENTLNRLIQIETEMGKTVNFSFSPKFGFLTADPMNCGTALNISIFLQLPGLVHSGKIDAVLDKYADENILITGIQGNPTDLVGDLIVLQNNYTLGVSEDTIGSILRNITTKLLVEENAVRNEIRQSQNDDIKDKVSRAFAILLHSYNIEAVEAMNALSLLKLGGDMGWVKGIELKDLNQVFFNCRRGHLLSKLPSKIAQGEVIHKRAEFIHQALKNAQLTI